MDRKFRMVIINSPYDARNDVRLPALFWHLAKLKIEGYSSMHFDGALAVGDCDFVARHKIICEDSNGQLTPLLGNYTITVAQARRHGIEFPALSLANGSNSTPHIEYVNRTTERCDSEGKTLSYDGGFTISPYARDDHELSKKLHELFGAMKVFFLKDYQIDECFTAAVVKFNVERTCKFWGYEAVIDSLGNRLPDIIYPRLGDLYVTLMHLKNLSQSSIETAQKHRAMWENRIVIEQRADVREKKAA